MPIKYTKKGTFWPVVTFFSGRLHDVEDDGNSIFIVVSDYSLVGIRCIPRNDAIFSYRAFSLLEVR